MDDLLLTIHSMWRWLVLLSGFGAFLLAAASGWARRPWDRLADRVSLLFTVSADVQVLIGIVLWIVEARWSGDVFLGWVHPISMLGATGLAHVGRARADRARDTASSARQPALLFGASLALMLLTIPLNSWLT